MHFPDICSFHICLTASANSASVYAVAQSEPPTNTGFSRGTLTLGLLDDIRLFSQLPPFCYSLVTDVYRTCNLGVLRFRKYFVTTVYHACNLDVLGFHKSLVSIYLDIKAALKSLDANSGIE